jgi:UDP-N-acetylmuramoyl-L-alanyl-D-glutamate--2,6-diaminopimelate ligase
MGAAAARIADHIVITSDNPRTEAPESIVDAIARGVPADRAGRVECRIDRAEAIAHALAKAATADVVLIAGKGHEEYQDVAGQKRSFSDVEHARAALARRAVHTDSTWVRGEEGGRGAAKESAA